MCFCLPAGSDTNDDTNHDAVVPKQPGVIVDPRTDDGNPRPGGHPSPHRNPLATAHDNARTGRHGYPAVRANATGVVEYSSNHPGTHTQPPGAHPCTATTPVRLGEDGGIVGETEADGPEAEENAPAGPEP